MNQIKGTLKELTKFELQEMKLCLSLYQNRKINQHYCATYVLERHHLLS